MKGMASAIAVAALAVTMVAAPPASGQEECSCTGNDAATSVELQITAAMPRDHSMIGPDQSTPVIDLRGQETVLVGDPPQLLEDVELTDVPVLMAIDDPSAPDGCGVERPPAGSDLSLTGHVYVEETGPVVWTGRCQGELTVEAAAQADPAEPTEDDDTWERGLAISAAILAGLAVLCLALIPLTARRNDRPS